MVNYIVETANVISELEKKIKQYESKKTTFARLSVIADVCDFLNTRPYKLTSYVGSIYFLGRIDDNAKKAYKKMMATNVPHNPT